MKDSCSQGLNERQRKPKEIQLEINPTHTHVAAYVNVCVLKHMY